MNTLNFVLFEGNIANNPQMVVSPQGYNTYIFTISSDKLIYNQNGEIENQEIFYFDIEIDKLQLILAHVENLKRNRRVRIAGWMRQDRWRDIDGTEYSKIKIIAEHIEFESVDVKEDQRES